MINTMLKSNVVKRLYIFLVVSLVSGCQPLESVTSESLSDSIIITDARVNLPLPNRDMTVAYFSIKNTSDTPYQLTSITSEWADTVEIHNHLMVDNVMKMVQVPVLTIPPKESIVFKPSGYHLMVFGVGPNLEKDAKLTFCFKQGECLTVQAKLQTY